MADLNRKKRVRAGHKASVTRMLNDSEALLTADPPDMTSVATLEVTLREKISVLDGLDNEIFDLLDSDDAVAEEIQQSDGFKKEVRTVLVRIEQLTRRLGTGSTVAAAPHRPAAPSTASSSAPASTVKLPKLTIAPFKGDPTCWTAFWDSFETAIDRNSSLTDIEKFGYLRSFLQGAALEAVSGFALSAANYAQALEVLKKRFGDQQLIISRHMDALLRLDSVTSDRHLRDLRKLHDSAEAHIRSLQSLGIRSDTYGSLLAPVLLAKLPPDMRLIITREVADPSLSMDALFKNFSQELSARERANPLASITQVGKSNHDKRMPPTTSSLLSSPRTLDDGPHCVYCRQAHQSSDCTTVVTVDARRSNLKSNGRCFNCLRRGHVLRTCRSSARCQKCRAKHHTSICNTAEDHGRSTLVDSNLSPAARAFQPNQTSINVCTSHSQAVLLQTARAVIHNPNLVNTSLEVRLLFDGGSQRSYLSERARNLLHLTPCGEQSLSIATFGSSRRSKKVCPIVSVCLSLKGYPRMKLSLYVVPTICDPLVEQPISDCVQSYPHLLGLTMADSSDLNSGLPVDLLVGADYYWKLVTGNVCRGEDGPTAVHTKLGWVLSGPSAFNSEDSSVNLSVTHVLHSGIEPDVNCALDNQLRAFWDLESFGVTEAKNTVLEEFQETIRFTGERYEVSLPWKTQCPSLPHNYDLCQYRLRGLLRRLRQNREILSEYDMIIKSQLQQGIVELVNTSSKTLEGESPKRIHYLPHHAVIRRDKDTTKIRVVYDASAKSDGPSLNQCLYTGPKFQQRIFDLLLRFRVYPVAVVADIEKAFLMVQVAEEDRDVLRFLWVRSLTAEQPELIELRFARVVFGVSCSPFLLNATIRYHLEHCQADPEIVKKMLRAFYVDDVVTGANDEDEAYELYSTAKTLLKEGGFRLRKFCSNSMMLQSTVEREENQNPHHVSPALCLNETDETYASITLGTSRRCNPGRKSVLGVQWNTYTDELVMSIFSLSPTTCINPTKRTIVSLVGKFFDPLGILSPVVISFKIFLQELCKVPLGWDDVLSGNLLERWQQLSLSLIRCQQVIPLPRCYARSLQGQPSHHTLCGFCDASLRAYAAVVYLLSESESGIQVDFVASKTRVSPLKQQTVPRLELLSAVLLARLIHNIAEAIREDLQVSSFRCYTDSTVALHWILGIDKHWKPFIHNRVSEIRRLIPPENWAHCSGKDNPADLPSRGLTMQELASSEVWLNGPIWLKDKSEPLDTPPMPDECLSELGRSDRLLTHGLLAADVGSGIEQVIDCAKYSSLSRLLLVTSLVLKFCHLLLSKVRHSKVVGDGFQTKAEVLWIQSSQSSLPKEKKFPQWKVQFDLFMAEDKIWRCKGRLQHSSLPWTTIHPILLNEKHHLTTLIVCQAHEKVMHCGTKATLTELRSRYWIVRGRSVVRRILRRCLICKRHEGPPFQIPPPPPLPPLRIEEVPPFTHTGVDFAGPLHIRHDAAESKKVWVCLFTCCVTRAIHLEVVPDLTTPAFLRSLKRFVARRGLPKKILSDNGKTFVAASKEIKAIVNHPDVQSYLSGLGVKWIFNLPRAPWWGGVFERLVKSVKRCLRKTIGQARLNLDELSTVLTEIEAVINSRPLTYISSDDIEEPLTPSHLLTGRRLMDFPDHLCREPEKFESTRDVLSKRARYLQEKVTHFWNRWHREYLTELRESHRYHHGKTNPDPVTVGEIVLIREDGTPRGFWKMGKVKELITGLDGRPRGAVLKVAGEGRCPTLKRSLRLLYPLEARTEHATSTASESVEETSAPDTKQAGSDDTSSSCPLQSRRPVREAAKRANLNRRALIQLLQEDEELED